VFAGLARTPEPHSLELSCLSRRRGLRRPVAGTFASREVAKLGQLGRLHLEIHACMNAFGMAALAGLGTVISHGCARELRVR
jgi:hypothetical protein